MDVVSQLRILKQIYSESTTWDEEMGVSVHRIPSTVTAQELQALEQAGHAPNNWVYPAHDETLAELKRLVERWTLAEAADAFVASLWSAPMIWRALLPGKLLAEAMPEHAYEPYPSSATCQICGLADGGGVDASLQWYFRMIESTPLDGNPHGYVLALRELAAAGQVPQPTASDRYALRRLLTILRELPPKTRYSKIDPLLKKEALLPVRDKYPYRGLLETLGLIGVLDTEAYPGLATTFLPYRKRDERPNTRVEIQAPLAWWDSSVGINERTLAQLFGAYDLTEVSASDKPEPVPALAETVTGALASRKAPRAATPKASPDAGKGPVEAGDVYAVRIREGAWVTVYCHEVKDNRARVEYMDGIYADMPSKAELSQTFRPRRDGRWQCRSASIDSTSWVRRIARGIACPQSELPEPDRFPFHGAKDLAHMANWCFPELKS
ncbi:hypothetical protein [Paenibacillus sp. 598K]|uniref:hypothetical protein n=1 Tax=Paenibacillus sp. 598K TaxID=1117987 RepID=UPI000FFEB39C|nr:hypothetical protein [Paenibacillus sp. 598K]